MAGSWYADPDPDSGQYPNDVDPSIAPPAGWTGGPGSYTGGNAATSAASAAPVFDDLVGTSPTTGVSSPATSQPQQQSAPKSGGSWYPAPDPDTGQYPNDVDFSIPPPPGYTGGNGSYDPSMALPPPPAPTDTGGHSGHTPSDIPRTPLGSSNPAGLPGTNYGSSHAPTEPPPYGTALNDIVSLSNAAWEPRYSLAGGSGGGFYALQGDTRDSWGNYFLQSGPNPQLVKADGTPTSDPSEATQESKDAAFDPRQPPIDTWNEAYIREQFRPWYDPWYMPRNPIRPPGSIL